MSAPSNPSLRIGNDERDAAIKALDEHLTAGRLDAEEYGERVAQASVARTREGLDGLFVDLPEPHPFPAKEVAWRGPTRPKLADRAYNRFARESALVRIAVLVLAAMVIIAALPFVVVAAILFFVVLPMLGCGWRGRPGGQWGGGGRRW
jgi:Domain of unknown function (DUF1707)